MFRSFAFIVEENNAAEQQPSDSASDYTGSNEGEPAHLNVGSDPQSKPSDPQSSTMNDIPVMSNEQSLLEHLKLKTRSFESSRLIFITRWNNATISFFCL